jgi:hypothetical protein
MAFDSVDSEIAESKDINNVSATETDGETSTPPTELASHPTPSTDLDEGTDLSAAFTPGLRVYAIVAGLGVANLLAALENTVVAIAWPVILSDLKVGDDFIWVSNAFFLCR